ncbi:MAG: hypothetical protein ACTSYO_03055, partial [Candidatus Ranarchaeia archaeon]
MLNEEFCEEAIRLVKLAQQNNIPLRVMGAIAIRIHCPKYRHLLDRFQRNITDIDFMTYGRYNSQVYDFFKKQGYVIDPAIFAFYGDKRHIWYEKNNRWVVDVFFDKLEMNHIIDFQKRLELDFPTITLADLLLEKMQIVKINEKDVQDTCVLLREHDVRNSEEETINGKRIAKVLSDDWGFYYTVTMNLKKVKE